MVAAALGWRVLRLQRRLERSERDRRRAADELNRRLSELFLSRSFPTSSPARSSSTASWSRWCGTPCGSSRRREPCGARGGRRGRDDAERPPLTVAAAEGTLAHLRGGTIAPTTGADHALAERRARELVDGTGGEPTPLVAGVHVAAAAAVRCGRTASWSARW